jgi:large subunit ribosomal protein L25
MKSVTIQGEAREAIGKKASKADRNTEKIPCVVYGRKDSVHFTTTKHDLRPVLFTPEFKIVNIEMGGKSYRAILKDVQFHPVNDEIRHVDFLMLYDGIPVKVELPLTTEGASPGVKSGGRLIQSVRKIKVKSLPENLVDELKVNIGTLKLGQSLRIKDITAVQGVEIIPNPSIPVVSVLTPRALKAGGAVAEESDDAEGESEE